MTRVPLHGYHFRISLFSFSWTCSGAGLYFFKSLYYALWGGRGGEGEGEGEGEGGIPG